MKYLKWDEKMITDFSAENVTEMYDRGYLFTRIGRGVMQRTRSVRIDLERFAPSSENRRILKKIENITLSLVRLPINEGGATTWPIGKVAKDFYDSKFGKGIMSAQKIKEMLTDGDKSNFNSLLEYSVANDAIGYAICYENKEIIHYSYPFYDLVKAPKDAGLGMMTIAIRHAQNSGKKYIYLGSLQRPNDTYKLQFEGLEWFDGRKWTNDIDEVKELLKSQTNE